MSGHARLLLAACFLASSPIGTAGFTCSTQSATTGSAVVISGSASQQLKAARRQGETERGPLEGRRRTRRGRVVVGGGGRGGGAGGEHSKDHKAERQRRRSRRLGLGTNAATLSSTGTNAKGAGTNALSPSPSNCELTAQEEEEEENTNCSFDGNGDAGATSAFGAKEYWDEMYLGRGDFPSDEYSWYCGWDALRSIWAAHVPKTKLKAKHEAEAEGPSRILVPGVGNDSVLYDMYASGWRRITAFDYSAAAVDRQRELLGDFAADDDDDMGERVALHVLDARALPQEWAGSFDAVFEKGALDAIYLSGGENVERAAAELARVVKRGGVVVSVSGVVPDEVRRTSVFPTNDWTWLRDGSDDLTAGVFVLRRR